MSRDNFGWELPPGCRDNDPDAPWNRVDTPEDCIVCGKPNEDGKEFCSHRCEQIFESYAESYAIAHYEDKYDY